MSLQFSHVLMTMHVAVILSCLSVKNVQDRFSAVALHDLCLYHAESADWPFLNVVVMFLAVKPAHMKVVLFLSGSPYIELREKI